MCDSSDHQNWQAHRWIISILGCMKSHVCAMRIIWSNRRHPYEYRYFNTTSLICTSFVLHVITSSAVRDANESSEVYVGVGVAVSGSPSLSAAREWPESQPQDQGEQ